jgi:hypothetical protein
MTKINKTNKVTAKQATIKPVASKQGSSSKTAITKPVKAGKLSEAKGSCSSAECSHTSEKATAKASSGSTARRRS